MKALIVVGLLALAGCRSAADREADWRDAAGAAHLRSLAGNLQLARDIMGLECRTAGSQACAKATADVRSREKDLQELRARLISTCQRIFESEDYAACSRRADDAP